LQERVLLFAGESVMVELGLGESSLMDKIKPLVVVGIPAFNEENTIAKVILGAQKYADLVVVCDDGSSDLTSEIAERLGAEVVRHERNCGYGAAIQSLFKRAQALNTDILVTLDGDGQHNPDEIPQLIEPIASGAVDVVVGSRFIDACGTEEMPKYRQFGVKAITFLTYGFGKGGVSDSQSGFRAYARQALGVLELSENGMSASVEILRKTGKQGLRMCEVPISCKYNNGDGVKTSTHNAVSHGFGVVFSILKLVVEDRPLLYLGVPGLLSLIAGIFFGVWMLQVYAVLHQIETNVALASMAFVLIGFFALSTAITLYAIARLAERTNGKR
jgi:glycosyltransferase involved in cell wall biosynthesis